MSSSLFTQTPSVAVHDARGNVLRQLAYYRHPDTPDETVTRITRHHYDNRGRPKLLADARLHEMGLANFMYTYDLVGHSITTQSRDAGTTIALNDSISRPLATVTNIEQTLSPPGNQSEAVLRTHHYDTSGTVERLLKISEHVSGEAAIVTERFVYGSGDELEKNRNLAGRRTRHYDPAGVSLITGSALSGSPLSSTRRLLKSADDVCFLANWQAENEYDWEALLAEVNYTTLTTVNALGQSLSSTDYSNHVQHHTFNVAGQFSASKLALDKQSRSIIESITYTATSRVLREQHGNGVVNTFSYDPRTERMSKICSMRPDGIELLHLLDYSYDPAGNVCAAINTVEPVRFWRNQRIEPVRWYTYDSLYQLISASGRELAVCGLLGGHPHLTTSLSDSTLTKYSRKFGYDSAGNLVQIRHIACATNNSYTQRMTASPLSNRVVSSSLTENPDEVERLFTPAGQQRELNPYQQLSWSVGGELRCVSLSAGGGTEHYRYDGSGRRVYKFSSNGSEHCPLTQQTLYLPTVEIRTRIEAGMTKEHVDSILMHGSGCTQVRALHWQSAKPGHIAKDSIRWSLGDLTDNCGLELDENGSLISLEEYYPFGGTAIFTARHQMEVNYKTARFSGKERDATGLYYYGHRYYQPWVGRWLSTDPAGTVAGINLFAMCENNPITLRDIGGLLPVTQNFNQNRGDLMYGLSDQILPYLDTITGKPYNIGEEGMPPIIINSYNAVVARKIYQHETAARTERPELTTIDIEKTIAPPPDLASRAMEAANYPLWHHYFEIGETHAKLNIANIYKEVQNRPHLSKYHSWFGRDMTPLLLWKRGSKLGIEIAASGGGNKIHYALDGIELPAVIAKRGDEGHSVTASELRYIFRNRKQLEGHIHFYRNQKKVSAPWQSNPWQWSKYSPQSMPKSRSAQFSSLVKSKFS